MRNRFLSLFLMLTVALALTGCKPDPNVQFIQGTWHYNDAHLGSVVGEPGQETYWTFGRGAFQFSTCCFVKAEQYGPTALMKAFIDRFVYGEKPENPTACGGGEWQSG